MLINIAINIEKGSHLATRTNVKFWEEDEDVNWAAAAALANLRSAIAAGAPGAVYMQMRRCDVRSHAGLRDT